jgi:hypothetical protein
MPSVGASQDSYMTLSNQLIPMMLASPPFVEPNFRWEVTDTGIAGGVRFVMSADIFGFSSLDSAGNALRTDWQEDALRRMACFYMLSHLDSDNLNDAYGNLAEIFEWQQRVPNHAPAIKADARQVPVSILAKTASPPFSRIDE